MRYWLIKSEPDVWSWENQVAAGAKGTPWDGVRNHAAKLNLMAMKKEDPVFFYHSNEGKAIVGVAEVAREHYPDPATPGEPWVLVDFKAVAPLPKPVSLVAVKAEPALAKMALVTLSRLSVQPVTDEEWATVCRMGEYKG
jgi:predicted RNA-binding protein with PUA-like domain